MLYIAILFYAVGVLASVRRQSSQVCSTIQGSSGPSVCSTACNNAFQVLIGENKVANLIPDTTQLTSINASVITSACDLTNTTGTGVAIATCAVCFTSGVGDNNDPWMNTDNSTSDQTFGAFIMLANMCAVYQQSGAQAALQTPNSTTFSSVYNICSGGGNSSTSAGASTSLAASTTLSSSTSATASVSAAASASTSAKSGDRPHSLVPLAPLFASPLVLILGFLLLA